MKGKNSNKGITLISLTVTCVVLMILAGITIGKLEENGGLITRAENVKNMHETGEKVEADTMGDYENLIAETTGPGSGSDFSGETIPTTQTYVGYYANLDADEEPEGIIYADLAIGGSGQWYNSSGAYSYDAITGTKEYYVSKANHEGPFGTKDVLTVVPNSPGEDRFYVMALEDFKTDSNTIFYWYYSAYSNKRYDYATIVSNDFGKGKSNTANMIAAWNASSYGSQNAQDMWGVIQEEVKDGWFVPSRGELGAFGNNLGIKSSNYTNYGLSSYCWSSSSGSMGNARIAYFESGFIGSFGIGVTTYVRLSATF